MNITEVFSFPWQNMPSARSNPVHYSEKQEKYLSDITKPDALPYLESLITMPKEQSGWGFVKGSVTLRRALEDIQFFSLSFDLRTERKRFEQVVSDQINKYAELPFDNKFFRNQYGQPQTAQQNDRIINQLVLRHVLDIFDHLR
jgi:hypothetical protein